MSAVLKLSQQLMNIPSVTPEGEACIELLTERLTHLGFSIERFDTGPAVNLWARLGATEPLVCFLGHVDVVPTGPESDWHTPPFEPTIKDDKLYGRGACDMKTGIAAFVVALEALLAEQKTLPYSIAFLITSAEEDMDQYGTPNVIKALEARGEKITYCITGEPSSTNQVGDIIRNGRRGSLSASLTVLGKQGHIAYPHLADNPIHKVFAAFADLTDEIWDEGDDFFPPTSLQFSNLNAGTGVGNVIPGEIVARFNFRFSPAVTAEQLQQRTEAILQQHKLDYRIDWHVSGLPFFTPLGALTQAASAAIEQVMQHPSEFSTGGGTSDARFMAPTGAQVIELGVSNQTAHQVNECVAVADLENLVRIYQQLLLNLAKPS